MCSSAFFVLSGLITVRSSAAPASAALTERNALSGSPSVVTVAPPSTAVTSNPTVPSLATRMLLRTVTSMPVSVDT